MKRAESMGHRAHGTGHRAQGTGQRAESKEHRAQCIGQREQSQEQRGLEQILLAAGSVLPLAFVLKGQPAGLAGRQSTSNQQPATSNKQQATSNQPAFPVGWQPATLTPRQFILSGSKHKTYPCLPRGGFNSGVCPGAAAITILYICTGSPRGTLGDSQIPGVNNSPALVRPLADLICTPADLVRPLADLVRPLADCDGHKVKEGLPMI
jgi:hypothetical protein